MDRARGEPRAAQVPRRHSELLEETAQGRGESGERRHGVGLRSRPVAESIVHFGREICGDLPAAERREWWLANGLGGYAAGTVAGTLTRRYHGLLIAPVAPPLGRMLVFAKADARLID